MLDRGNMQRLAIIGQPIAHSLSPVIYNAVFPAMGIDAVYEAWLTPPEGVAEAIRRLRGPEMLGMNVTVPHKEAVLSLLDQVDETAKAIGAVNCISKEDGRLVGHNTDLAGFMRSLREAGYEPRGRRVVVLGAGGSARAVAYGLAQAGGEVCIAARDHIRSSALVSGLQTALPGVVATTCGWQDASFDAACNGASLIVNCTPVGMLHGEGEDQSPLPGRLLRPGLWVCDLVYNPRQTPLLREAEAAGARYVSGLEMLVYQAVECVRLWTGREPPVDIMRKAAENALRGGS